MLSEVKLMAGELGLTATAPAKSIVTSSAPVGTRSLDQFVAVYQFESPPPPSQLTAAAQDARTPPIRKAAANNRERVGRVTLLGRVAAQRGQITNGLKQNG